MRTKTLLLTAALSAAGIATSMAQVYSVNAVGYVNTPLAPGFNLVSNPLDNTSGGNSIQNLFGTGINGPIPDGFFIYYFANNNFEQVAWESLDNAFSPPAKAATLIPPGSGVFVRNPNTTPITVTFVGEVRQGSLSHNIPQGFSIQSSEVPQAGTAAALGLVGQNGDVVYTFNETTQNYNTPSAYDAGFGEWDPALPTLEVGEAFFFLNRNAARPWTRTFSVNQ